MPHTNEALKIKLQKFGLSLLITAANNSRAY